MPALIERRRVETERRIRSIQRELSSTNDLLNGWACVYLTGSFARGEATRYSDLDLFLAGSRDSGDGGLSRLDATLVKADLIRAIRRLNIPDFSGDGEYLDYYTLDDLVGKLGHPEDDVANTFTARLLLLLESRPLLGEESHRRIVRQVVRKYWRDWKGHEKDFLPGFLINDILRMWRTFCINYEARTEDQPARKRAKRKLKNFKLKHSRLLTCYSALVFLLEGFERKGTVSPHDAAMMVGLSPVDRLNSVARRSGVSEIDERVQALLARYEDFLVTTDAPEEELLDRFLRKRERIRLAQDADAFGDEMFQLIAAVGNGGRFHRLLSV